MPRSSSSIVLLFLLTRSLQDLLDQETPSSTQAPSVLTTENEKSVTPGINDRPQVGF